MDNEKPEVELSAEEKSESEKLKAQSEKVIPERDFLAFKQGSLGREKRIKEELARTKDELAQIRADLDIARTNVDDDEEVKKVRQYLLDEDRKVRAERKKLEEEWTSYRTRDKEARVKMFSAKYGVDEKDLIDEEDPEKKALELFAERLLKEKKELEKKSAPGSVYEASTGLGISKKAVKDMSDAEFLEYEKKLKAKAASR